MAILGTTARALNPTPFTPQPDPAFLADVLGGLASAPQKRIPPKYFYDHRGSELFERITRSRDYYVTRVESEVLCAAAAELPELVGRDGVLIEFGSGSSAKTRTILRALERLRAYIAIDISELYLLEAATELAREFPFLKVVPVVDDFTGRMKPLESAVAALGSLPQARRIGFFPGSTLGNFSPMEAERLLRSFAGLLGHRGLLLIGIDLLKDPAILERAYNDSEGLTAEFNLNLLDRINRELGADFDRKAFHHYAFFAPQESRVEMHLVSDRPQTVTVGGRIFGFRRGETIHTECSYKFLPSQFEDLASRAGLRVRRRWTDHRGWFGVFLLEVY